MLFVAKELEEDGMSNIGMFSSFQYSFYSKNVFEPVSYLETGILWLIFK